MTKFLDDSLKKIAQENPFEPALITATNAAVKVLNIVKSRRVNQDYQIHKKDDGTFVTDVDLQAHEIICNAIQSSFPGDLIVSEEGSFPTWSELLAANQIWVTDPLDGTTNFIEGYPDYCVNIALLTKSESSQAMEPVLGVIAAPHYNEIYLALQDRGTWLLDLNSSTAIRYYGEPSRRRNSPLVARTYDTTPEQLERFLQEQELTSDINSFKSIYVGAALRFAKLAQGEVDVLAIPFNGYSIWDIAAGDALFRHSVRDGEKTRASMLKVASR